MVLSIRGWRWVGLGVEIGGFKDQGWRWVGVGICKVGGVGSGSNHAPWILYMKLLEGVS